MTINAHHNLNVWEKIGVVIVGYNSARVIGDCLRALGPAAQIVVVDNASLDDTEIVVKAAAPHATIIKNATNRGYGAACNQGMAALETTFGLTVTPDVILQPGIIECLMAEHETNRTGIVVPVLYSEDGVRDLPVMGPTETTHQLSAILPEGPFCTWFVTGAAWLCKMEAWHSVGGFDENILLYGEDVDISLRMTKAGWPMVVLPDVSVRHLGGKSTPPSMAIRWRRDWHMTWSHFYIQGKHRGLQQARTDARALGWSHVCTALKYTLLLNPKYVIGNIAKAHAAFSYASGKPSH